MQDSGGVASCLRTWVSLKLLDCPSVAENLSLVTRHVVLETDVLVSEID